MTLGTSALCTKWTNLLEQKVCNEREEDYISDGSIEWGANPIPSFMRSTLALDVSFSIKVNATLIAVAGL